MSIKQHPDFSIKDRNILNARIWHYMKAEHLIYLLKNKFLYFTRTDLLGDEFEGSYTLIDYKRSKRAKELRKSHTPKTIIEQIQRIKMPNFFKLLKKYVYINCWHINNNESHPMWASYTDKGKGVAITTTISSLINSIKNDNQDFLLGLVKYIDYKKNTISRLNIFNPFFSKRLEFSSEREFRIAMYFLKKIDPFDRKKTDLGISIEVDLNKLIEKIIYSPFYGKKEITKIIGICKQYNIVNKIYKSSLTDSPLFPK